MNALDRASSGLAVGLAMGAANAVLRRRDESVVEVTYMTGALIYDKAQLHALVLAALWAAGLTLLSWRNAT